VTGSGQFLMDSLKISTLGLSIVAPGSASAVPLGQPLTIAAQLESGGVAVTGTRYSLTGALTYAGGAGQYSQDFVLDDSASPGVYKAHVLPPAGAPPGAYSVTVVAREVSDTIASATRSLRIERFPTPVLLSPSTHQPAQGVVTTQVTRWDELLSVIYGGPLNWLGQWPLQGRPANPTATVQGQVVLDAKPYGAATVSGSVAGEGGRSSVPLIITQHGGGAFTAAFPATASGGYTLTLDTQGSFQDSHGDLGVTTQTARVIVVQAPVFWQEMIAWLITLLYVALLLLLVLVVRCWLSPRPFGRLVASDGSGAAEFARARRGVWALLQPSEVRSERTELGPGLKFVFGRGHRILVKAAGSGADDFRLGGERLTRQAIPATESTLTAHGGESSYIVSASGADDDDDDGMSARPSGLFGRRRRVDDFDDDDDYAPRRRGAGLAGLGRRHASDDDDEQPARRSRGRVRYADDDDDAEWSRQRARRAGGARGDGDDAPTRTRSRRGARSRYDDDEW
jgi:hypothetical protein